MDPRKLFADERHGAFCVFCGAAPATREHVVSKVLLDDPLPDDLPLVYSCLKCNNGFARDEEYLACLVDCVVSGSTDTASLKREKVRASLSHSPALAARIAAGRVEKASGTLVWHPEEVRVRNVVVKLARGHVAHQYSEPQLDEPEQVTFIPLTVMANERRAAFETVPESVCWPEIGSRAFVNSLVVGDSAYLVETGWTILQQGRYRYAVAKGDGIVARFVLSEYLGCEVIW